MFKFISPLLVKLAGGLVSTAEGAKKNPQTRDTTSLIALLATTYFGFDLAGAADGIIKVGTWLKNLPDF